MKFVDTPDQDQSYEQYDGYTHEVYGAVAVDPRDESLPSYITYDRDSHEYTVDNTPHGRVLKCGPVLQSKLFGLPSEANSDFEGLPKVEIGLKQNAVVGPNNNVILVNQDQDFVNFTCLPDSGCASAVINDRCAAERGYIINREDTMLFKCRVG